MYLQGVESVYDLIWADTPSGQVTYGDVYHQNEVEMSTFNFQEADVDYLFSQFEFCEKEAMRLAQNELPLPAYEHVMKASHTFNLLDARHAIGVTERQRYILRVRALARAAAEAYVAAREPWAFPKRTRIWPRLLCSNSRRVRVLRHEYHRPPVRAGHGRAACGRN